MRTEKNRVDAAADLRERPVHALVDRIQRRDVQEPSADPRLVGRHDDAISGVIQARDGLEAAGNRPPFVRRFDE